MTKEKFKRIVAFYLAINIFFEVASPTAAWALTSGPGQPEMASFEPVGTTEMVDLFSGDFNYNIPLLTVPGPNGGYPINIAYHAGAGVEDEASWVGLGWNINPGVVSRDLRGLPDDFNGEEIDKSLNMRPNKTVVASWASISNYENWGFKFSQTLKQGLTWNNYQGIGFTGGFSSSILKKSNSSKALMATYGFGLSLDYNSLSGETNLSPSISLSSKLDRATSFHLGFTVSSLNGIKDASFSMSRNRTYKNKDITNYNTTKERLGLSSIKSINDEYNRSVAGGSTSFSSSSFVSHSEFPNTGFSLGTDFNLGLDAGGVYNNFEINADYIQNELEFKQKGFKGYGYNFSNEGASYNANPGSESDNYKLMDFNREKEAALSRSLPSLPASVYTHDVFVAKGQGIGSVFRSYRNDIAYLRDPEIKSQTYGGTFGGEVGPGVPFHFGMNVTFMYSKNYTGPWREMDYWNDVKKKTYGGGATGKELTYFRSPSDMTANLDEEDDYYFSSAGFPLTQCPDLPDWTDIAGDPFEFDDNVNLFMDFRINNNNIIGDKLHYANRQSRSQLISYKTVKEIQNIPGYENAYVDNKYVFDEGKYPRDYISNSYSYTQTYHARVKDQIGEVSVMNADGNKYIYAIPAYNKNQKEVSFSFDKFYGNGRSLTCQDKIANYTAEDASVGNKQLDENFYMHTKLPPYAHSYLLTLIVSPDYVDLTGNGPSDDDFGYWVKFNYTKTADEHKWRMPFMGANFIKGKLSNDNDDKAGYAYGEKELWYLNSIETKSHIAEFELGNDRKDAFGANNELQNFSTTASGVIESTNGNRYLKSISLYSKQDPAYLANNNPVPLKKVNFDYNYELCKGIYNNQNYNEGQPLTDQKGKLTLKKIYFSYLGSKKGELSPYLFDYGTALAQNPNYHPFNIDRWGNYRKYVFESMSDSTIHPYVMQSRDYNRDGSINQTDIDERNGHASAWCLRTITLPSGGKIKVDYEQDDYSYVHDKKAAQMYRILGFTNQYGIDNNFSVSSLTRNLNEYKDILVFELNDPTQAPSNQNFLDGISNEVYFNVFMDIKANLLDQEMARDYVNGYAKAVGTGIVNASGGDGKYYGYVKLAPVTIKDQPSTSGPMTHPFRKATWQYLKLERTDLLFPATNNSNSNGSGGTQFVKQVASSMIGALSSLLDLINGYYSSCYLKGYAKQMSDQNPSFIRLSCIDKQKYGGGHRVKTIKIADTWKESTDAREKEWEYGQQYSYVLPNGQSSGVASYEPMNGGDEIPHRSPIRYSSNSSFLFKDKNLYIEEPIGEAYYPSPGVGYSRVIVKNIDQKDSNDEAVTKALEGTTVYEFYTTKDFPFFMNRNSPEHEKFRPKIPIPFIGSVSFEDHAFSQWMSIETNDMHGKVKSVATYGAGADINSSNVLPVTKVEYIYNTNAPYNPNGTNTLKNEVNVLFGDGYSRLANIGLQKEHFIDLREASGAYFKQGMQSNMEYTYPAFMVFNANAIIDYSETMFKSVLSMHLKARNGILMETRSYNQGSTITSKNLMFDANSGKPLLTTVTNNFDKPVYNYEYAAHWAYDDMSNAYTNDRARFAVAYCPFDWQRTEVVPEPAADLVSPGDELYITDGTVHKRVWVKSVVNVGHIVLMDEDGANYVPSSSSTWEAIVIRSARRNQQGISNGFIQSLTNPVTSRKFDLFDTYNQLTSGQKCDGCSFESTDCGSKEEGTYTIDYNLPDSTVTFVGVIGDMHNTKECNVTVYFPKNFPATWSAWSTYTFKKSGQKVFVINPANNAVVAVGELNDQCGLTECLDGVLNASASEFAHKGWVYDYQDAGNPNVNFAASGSHALSSLSLASANHYRIGTEGIWRMQKNWAYQTERKQTPNVTPSTSIANPAITNIQGDGTFEEFVLFDWNAAQGHPTLNTKWTQVNEVTRYSPYGYELENANAIGVKSSAIYGYNNSVQTSIASNASYYETAFEGFEDHGTATTYNAFHGHLKINETGTALSSSNAHTGKKSIVIGSGQTLSVSVPVPGTSNYSYFIPTNSNKKYVVSAWFKNEKGAKPTIAVSGGTDVQVFSDGIIIEGWQKVEMVYTATSSAATISFSIAGASGNGYLDDVRIQPFKSTMKTFVYDPYNLWLVAELDGQNYATFYNYDQEGTLVQVKKETVNGIQTLKTTRSNIQRP